MRVAALVAALLCLATVAQASFLRDEPEPLVSIVSLKPNTFIEPRTRSARATNDPDFPQALVRLSDFTDLATGAAPTAKGSDSTRVTQLSVRMKTSAKGRTGKLTARITGEALIQAGLCTIDVDSGPKYFQRAYIRSGAKDIRFVREIGRDQEVILRILVACRQLHQESFARLTLDTVSFTISD